MFNQCILPKKASKISIEERHFKSDFFKTQLIYIQYVFKERFFLFQFEDVTKLTGSKMCSHNSHLAKTLSGSSVLEERGRIHGYPSRVELGRVSDEIGKTFGWKQ